MDIAVSVGSLFFFFFLCDLCFSAIVYGWLISNGEKKKKKRRRSNANDQKVADSNTKKEKSHLGNNFAPTPEI
jgi:hypothetical protein